LDILYAEILNNSSKENFLVSDSKKTIQNDKLTIGSGSTSKNTNESKSLKLYLFSYRSHGAFHEDCTIQIAKDIITLIKPKWLRIGGYWYPRGGIPIDIFFQTSTPPKDLFIPKQGISNYKARN
jgi:NADPH-dependent 7-cyano-7-deazaguanine reductase QueF